MLENSIQELTQKDIDDILAWKRSIEDKRGCLAGELVSYFAPQIIGYEHVKNGLLMVARQCWHTEL